MKNRLEPILLQKKQEVADLYQRLAKNSNHPIARALRGEMVSARPSFKEVLKSPSLSVIAEIKRKSPSKGVIASIPDPVSLAKRYIRGGANAISILTDQKFFNGHLNDLIQVVEHEQTIPVLRKDFIIDKVQIAEAFVVGASAVLCIITVLHDKAKTLIEYAHALGLDVLVEIHDIYELKIALDCGADIIGVNNRNLKTFEVNVDASFQIRSAIPDEIITVAESGITHPDLAKQYDQAGFNAILVGEALVSSDNPKKFIRECRDGRKNY